MQILESKPKLAGLKVFAGDELSCPSSRNYVNRYVDFIKSHGASCTKTVSEADIILIDTCAYSKSAEDNSLNYMKRNQKCAKPGATFIVSGCLASINPQKLKEEYQGHFFSPKTEKHLAQILGLDEEESTFLTAYEPRGRFMTPPKHTTDPLINLRLQARRWLHKLNDHLPLENLSFFDSQLACSQGLNENTYSITISQGCLGNCSFCVIPFSKGKTSSLPLGVIIDEIQKKLSEGVKDFYLVSEDTGAYGHDLKSSIVDLLEKLNQIPNDFKIYLHFFDPRWLLKYGEELISIFEKGKVRILNIPLQSGSNAVLARMKRAYQVEKVWPVVETIQKRFPRLYLTTEFIVGFPGETEEEFNQTRDIVKRGVFKRINVFGFSKRPGAATDNMPNHLPQEIVDKRAKILSSDIPFYLKY